MSDEKREQLIEAGRLRPDGSRIERCPTCGHDLTGEEYEAIFGAAIAHAEAVGLEADIGEPS